MSYFSAVLMLRALLQCLKFEMYLLRAITRFIVRTITTVFVSFPLAVRVFLVSMALAARLTFTR